MNVCGGKNLLNVVGKVDHILSTFRCNMAMDGSFLSIFFLHTIHFHFQMFIPGGPLHCQVEHHV